MLEHTLLLAVAEQLLTAGKGEIVIDDQKFEVKRVGSGRLRSVNLRQMDVSSMRLSKIQTSRAGGES